MNGDRFLDLVLPSGHLDGNKVLGRQMLYKGRNGKYVERFLVDTEHGRQTFIFKPLTNLSTFRREIWIAENLLHSLSVSYPKLISYAKHNDPDRFWSIYEDMGELSHRLNANDYIDFAAIIPQWHKLPLTTLPTHFEGDKPKVKDTLKVVLKEEFKLKSILGNLGVSENVSASIYDVIKQSHENFETEVVISHGDFHQGNLCVKENKWIILDWEYAHHNSIYWDLYCLLDLPHPDYPKMVSTDIRLAALNSYMNKRAEFGWMANPSIFISYYLLYVVIYSLWMLLLIEKDMHAVQWPVPKLLLAQEETLTSLIDCFNEYRKF